MFKFSQIGENHCFQRIPIWLKILKKASERQVNFYKGLSFWKIYALYSLDDEKYNTTILICLEFTLS